MAFFKSKTEQSNSAEEAPMIVETVVGINLADGALYSGKTLNGIPEGPGVIKLLGGTYFKGEFKNGTPEGKGKLRLKSGEIVEGEFRNGIFQGKRRLNHQTFPYQAMIRNGRLVSTNTFPSEEPAPEPEIEQFEESVDFESTPVEETIEIPAAPVTKTKPKKEEFTWGVKTYPTGTYEGEFRFGKREGRGKFIENSGAVYEGEFKNDRPHGRIIMKNPEKGMVFDGEYRNGEMRKGTLIINGMTYIGQFRRGIYHGDGKYIGADGNIVEGTFRWGKYMGPKKDKKPAEKKQ